MGTIAINHTRMPDFIHTYIISNEMNSYFLTEVNRIGFMKNSCETADIHLRINK